MAEMAHRRTARRGVRHGGKLPGRRWSLIGGDERLGCWLGCSLVPEHLGFQCSAEAVRAAPARLQHRLVASFPAVRTEDDHPVIGLEALAPRAHVVRVELGERQEPPDQEERAGPMGGQAGSEGTTDASELAVALNEPLVVRVDDLLEPACRAPLQRPERKGLADPGLLGEERDHGQLRIRDLQSRSGRPGHAEHLFQPASQVLHVRGQLFRHRPGCPRHQQRDGEHGLHPNQRDIRLPLR